MKSDAIKKVKWWFGTLEIEFKNGRVYRYKNVPKQLYYGMINAKSVGKYFRDYIKDRYEYERVK